MNTIHKSRNLVAVAAVLLGASSGSASAQEVADAVMRGDNEALARLLAEGADVNAPQADGATALHWAAYRDDLDVMRQLVGAGADVHVPTRAGQTPLLMASTAGNAEMVRLLLEAGADPNQTFNNGETPLMMAARAGSAEAIKVLIERGAATDATESLRGTTALMWAAAYSRSEAVRALLEAGADYSLQSAAVGRGRGPYLAPTARSRIEGAARTRDSAGGRRGNSDDGESAGDDGADAAATGAEAAAAGEQVADAEDPEAEEAEQRTAFGGRRRANDHGGLTPLIFAAREGDMKSAELLIEAGADVNQASEYGSTPLLAATQNRYYQLGRYLLEHGADPNIDNGGGWNPLYIATDNRNIEGGDYPTRSPDMDHMEYIRLLLARGADPNLRMRSSTETRTIFTHQWLYEEGATPFLRAAQSGDLELMKLLLEHGADPSIPTEDGVTPLMVAAGIGWVEGVTHEWSPQQTFEAVKLLLELGADVNVRDAVDGRTALMGAAHKGRSDVVQLLVDHGADLGARDIGSRDSINQLAGVTWQAIDYADGLVRVGVQSAVAHPETAALLRGLMEERGLPVPPDGRTLDSICITELCR